MANSVDFYLDRPWMISYPSSTASDVIFEEGAYVTLSRDRSNFNLSRQRPNGEVVSEVIDFREHRLEMGEVVLIGTLMWEHAHGHSRTTEPLVIWIQERPREDGIGIVGTYFPLDYHLSLAPNTVNFFYHKGVWHGDD